MNAAPYMQQRVGPFWGAVLVILVIPWSLVALAVVAVRALWRAFAH